FGGRRGHEAVHVGRGTSLVTSAATRSADAGGASFRHFDHQVEKRVADLGEPVRDAIRDDEDVAFFQLVRRSAHDLLTAQLTRGGWFHSLAGAAGDDRGGAFGDIEDV